MKHSLGGAVAERMPKSLWEDFLRYGSSWDDLEDGLTRSRAAVIARPPVPADLPAHPEVESFQALAHPAGKPVAGVERTSSF
jgi:hypothetical protein